MAPAQTRTYRRRRGRRGPQEGEKQRPCWRGASAHQPMGSGAGRCWPRQMGTPLCAQTRNCSWSGTTMTTKRPAFLLTSMAKCSTRWRCEQYFATLTYDLFCAQIVAHMLELCKCGDTTRAKVNLVGCFLRKAPCRSLSVGFDKSTLVARLCLDWAAGVLREPQSQQNPRRELLRNQERVRLHNDMQALYLTTPDAPACWDSANRKYHPYNISVTI
eukprot:9490500-Pyramimonas_sp.AAC.1